MKRQRSPREIIEHERRLAYLKNCYQLTRTLAVAILYDRFEFTEEQARWFLEDFDFLAECVGMGEDDLVKIKENIKAVIGVDLDKKEEVEKG